MTRAMAASIAALLAMAAASCGNGGQQTYDWGWNGDTIADAVTDTAAGGDSAQGDEGRRDAAASDDLTSDGLMEIDALPGDVSIDAAADGLTGDLPGDDGSTSLDSAVQDAADVSDDPTVGGFDLTGTWAQLHVSSRMSKPFMGSPAPSATTSIQLVRITFESGKFFIETDLCSLTLGQTSAIVTTVVPQAFVDSIPTVKREFTLVENDGAVQFTEPEHVVLYGVNLANPKTDPLPEDPEDPTVWDQDGDGHPGMTIQVKGLVSGDFYLVQRTAASMTGPVEDNDRFDGLITSLTDQKYLASSPESLMTYVPETYPDSDASHSYYRHTRIDPSWGCSQIQNNQENLFTR